MGRKSSKRASKVKANWGMGALGQLPLCEGAGSRERPGTLPPSLASPAKQTASKDGANQRLDNMYSPIRWKKFEEPLI
jgi:hypothetical protein